MHRFMQIIKMLLINKLLISYFIFKAYILILMSVIFRFSSFVFKISWLPWNDLIAFWRSSTRDFQLNTASGGWTYENIYTCK